MKYLLNENLSILRIANINSDKREYEEFLQSMFELKLIEFSNEQLLTEGFLDKVKETFKKATDSSKKYLQYSFNQFKKHGEKPSEFVKDIGDVFQDVDIKDPNDLNTILKLAKIQSINGDKLSEADIPAVKIGKVEDLEKLKNGQNFIWTGPINKDMDLKPGEEYLNAYDKVNKAWITVNVKDKVKIE
jgi:hypothetical protein